MVQRVAAPDLQLGGQQQAQVQQTQLGNKQIDQLENQAVAPATRDQPGVFDSLIGTIKGSIDKLASKQLSVDLEEAYIKGEQKAAMGEVESNLQADPLTKDWQTAGFRDMAGKLAAADTTAEFAGKWKDYRQLSPEQFQQILQAKTDKMVPQMEGMSREVRKSMLAQQVMEDRTLAKQYEQEHAKYILEMADGAAKAKISTSLQSVTASRGNLAQHQDALALFADTVYSNTLGNPALSNAPQVARTRLGEALDAAISAGNPMVMDIAQVQRIPGADGKMHSLYEFMDLPDQQKTQATFRRVMQETSAVRNFEVAAQAAKMQEDFKLNPDQHPAPAVEKFVRDNSGPGKLFDTDNAVKSYMSSYYEAIAKNGKLNAGVNAYMSGDLVGLYASGLSQQEAASKVVEKMAKARTPVTQIMDNLVVQQRQLGSDAATNMLGNLAGTALNQMIYSKEITPQAKEVTTKLFDILSKFKGEGDMVSYNRAIEALPPDQFKFVATVMHLTNANATTETKRDAAAVLDQARAITMREPLGTKGDRAAWEASIQKDRLEVLKTLDAGSEVPLLGITTNSASRVLNALSLGTLSKDSPAVSELRQTLPWFGNIGAVKENVQKIKDIVAERYTELRMYEGMDDVTAKSRALADATQQQIMTKFGPLVVPRSVDIYNALGVDRSVNKDLIGRALSLMVPQKPGDKEYFSFSMTNDGRMQIKTFKDDGTFKEARVMSPEQQHSVGTYIDQAKRNEQVEVQKAYSSQGETTPYVDHTGTPLKINGQNDSGLEPRKALELRRTLLKYEGNTFKTIENTYTDSKGVQFKDAPTIGPGINMNFTKIPLDAQGRATAQDLAGAFSKLSSQAMGNAVKTQRAFGLDSMKRPDEEVTLLTHLNYQSMAFAQTKDGKAFLDAYGAAVKTDNIAADKTAWAAFRDTTAYKRAGDVRRKYYDQLLTTSLRIKQYGR